MQQFVQCSVYAESSAGVPAVASTHAPGRGEGFKGLKGWLRGTITAGSCCRMQGLQTMPSGGKIDATHAPGRGGELDRISVEYSEPLAAWILLRQGTHGSYAAQTVDGCARTRFVYFSNKYRGCWKKQMSRQQNNNRQHRAACTPHSTLYSSQESRSLQIFQRFFRWMRFTHSAVVSNA